MPRVRCAGEGAAQSSSALPARPQTDSVGAEQESGVGHGALWLHWLGCVHREARECAGHELFQLLLWGRVAFSGVHLFCVTGETSQA